MRIVNTILGLALLGASSAALAGEPVRLDAAQLDSVSAGVFSGGFVAFTFPSGVGGNSASLTSFAQGQTEATTNLTPPTFDADFQVLAQSVVVAQASGVGATSSFGGGGIYSTVFVAP